MKLDEIINNRNLTRNNIQSKNTKSKVTYRIWCQFPKQRCRELKNKWWLTKTAELMTLVKFDKKVFKKNHEKCERARRESPKRFSSVQQQNNNHRKG